MSREWLGTLDDACAMMRKWARRPEADEAIRWFNEEYSDRAVRQRRAEAEPDPPLCRVDRPSARQLLGVGPDESSVAWRIHAALFDLSSEETPGECTPWVKRSERIVHALKLLLAVALAVDADVEEYLGDRVEIATQPIGTESLERHTRRYAAFLSGLDSGDRPWPERLSEALRQLREAEATHGWGPPSTGAPSPAELPGWLAMERQATPPGALHADDRGGQQPAATKVRLLGAGTDDGNPKRRDSATPSGSTGAEAPTANGDARNGLTGDWPTTEDLASEAGISDDTLRRIRKQAGIRVAERGAAARRRRYSPKEVDQLIAAVRAGNFMERTKIPKKWARWGTPGGG